MIDANAHEKRIERWRDWKIALIERVSPRGDDLAIGFGLAPGPIAAEPAGSR